MANPDFLRRTRCLHRTPERVQNDRFTQQTDFFDPKDIVQVKYELLRSCEVEGRDVASACLDFGFSRTTYYKVLQAFLEGGLPALMGRPRGRLKPIKVTDVVRGYLIAEKAKNSKLSAHEMIEPLKERYQVELSERMIQYVWQRYGPVKKKLNPVGAEAFEQHHLQSSEYFRSCPRRSFVEPLTPAQQLYESLRWLHAGEDDFSQHGLDLVHLNGQAEVLMEHFHYQGMSGLLGFNASFIGKRSNCTGSGAYCGAKPWYSYACAGSSPAFGATLYFINSIFKPFPVSPIGLIS